MRGRGLGSGLDGGFSFWICGGKSICLFGLLFPVSGTPWVSLSLSLSPAFRAWLVDFQPVEVLRLRDQAGSDYCRCRCRCYFYIKRDKEKKVARLTKQ